MEGLHVVGSMAPNDQRQYQRNEQSFGKGSPSSFSSFLSSKMEILLPRRKSGRSLKGLATSPLSEPTSATKHGSMPEVAVRQDIAEHNESESEASPSPRSQSRSSSSASTSSPELSGRNTPRGRAESRTQHLPDRNGSAQPRPLSATGSKAAMANMYDDSNTQAVLSPSLLAGFRDMCSSELRIGSPRAPAAKLKKRRIELAKPAASRFGVDLCRINGGVYVLNVHDRDSADPSDGKDDTANVKYLPGYRIGLSRFDEVVQLSDEDIGVFSLEDVYRHLHLASKVVLTVRDRPSVQTYEVCGALELDQLVSCLTGHGELVCVNTEKIPQDADWLIPKDQAIAEVDGQVVLGMTATEIAAVMRYALHKSPTGSIEVCTIVPLALAQAFLTSFQMTTTVYGENSWTDRDHLRRSLRHSQRQANGSPWAARRSSLRDSLRFRKLSSSDDARSATPDGRERAGGHARNSSGLALPNGSSNHPSRRPGSNLRPGESCDGPRTGSPARRVNRFAGRALE